MKKIILLFLVISNLYSQNIIDPPKIPQNFNNTAVFDREWDKTHFVRGWNWGEPGRKFDEALNINSFIKY